MKTCSISIKSWRC